MLICNFFLCHPIIYKRRYVYNRETRQAINVSSMAMYISICIWNRSWKCQRPAARCQHPLGVNYDCPLHTTLRNETLLPLQLNGHRLVSIYFFMVDKVDVPTSLSETVFFMAPTVRRYYSACSNRLMYLLITWNKWTVTHRYSTLLTHFLEWK